MPHIVEVRCPSCSGNAAFEFAELVRIKKKEDVPFFQSAKQFEYQRLQDSCGHFWHAALYCAGLHGRPSRALHDLPAGYSATEWEHSKYLLRSTQTDTGSVTCTHCGLRRMHRLQWPEEAYFAVTYRHELLWAFNRESALELLGYLSSGIRDISRYRWRNFLLHVPSLFKSRGARDAVSKQLQMLLRTDGRSNRRLQPIARRTRAG